MATEGYQYLIYTCPQVQSELLQVLCLDCGGGVAVANMNREGERPGFPIFCTTTHLALLPTPLQPTGHLGAQSVSGYSVSARRPGPSEGGGGRGRRDGPAPPQSGGGRGVVYGGVTCAAFARGTTDGPLQSSLPVFTQAKDRGQVSTAARNTLRGMQFLEVARQPVSWQAGACRGPSLWETPGSALVGKAPKSLAQALCSTLCRWQSTSVASKPHVAFAQPSGV